jgi:hypothetical protein
MTPKPLVTAQHRKDQLMALSPYGARERAKLTILNEGLQVGYPDGTVPTAIADMLRQQLPDMDDVTIGRVVIALTVEGIIAGVAQGADSRMQNLWAALTIAGLQLTESEWKTSETGGTS